MPRPKTRGERIQVQLPLDVDAAVRAKAAKTDTGPAAIIVDLVTRACRKVAPIREPDGHTHRRERTNAASLHVCECGAVRGVDGEWR